MAIHPANNGPAAAVAATSQEQARIAAVRESLFADIRVKWTRFSNQELIELKSNDDLVSRLIAKYGLEKAAAQRDAEMLRAGRDIL